MIRRNFLTMATLLAVVALHGSAAQASLIGVTFNNTPAANWGTLSGNGSLTNLTDV